jgi:alkaline phosphatase D
MKNLLFTLFFTAFFLSCETPKTVTNTPEQSTMTLAFGSCNDQKRVNYLWKEIAKHQPTAWLWGGDNTYSDTDNMETLWRDYQVVLNNPDYQQLKKTSKIFATWDDHDYGMNDGGVTFHAKKQSQAVFLDFLDVPKNDKRRQQEGVYYAEILKSGSHTVKIIMLDTRYFRSDLTKNDNPKKRYQPSKDGKGTMLGEKQWAWLATELKNSKADFNVIMSSVQVLSYEHGFETWGNLPHEVDKLKTTIASSKAKSVLILSGDRHISEFSKTSVEGLSYPLIDFTSSGLTHAYDKFKEETNAFRIGEVVPKISYGLLILDFKNRVVTMQIRGKEDFLLGELKQQY